MVKTQVKLIILAKPNTITFSKMYFNIFVFLVRYKTKKRSEKSERFKHS